MLIAACAAPALREGKDTADAASEQIPPYTLERFREERKVLAGVQRVVLDNPYGDLQIRQTSGALLAIEGVEQRIGEQPRIARIEWQESDHESAVRVRYPGIDPDLPADRRKGRVDLYAFVPVGVQVDLRSDFGEIVVRRIDNPVRARSSSGRITVAAHGTLDVESQTGELRIYPMSARGVGMNRLRTAGGIVLDVHLQPPLQLDAVGARGVRADFPLDALAQGEDGVWRASLSLPGDHGAEVRRFEIGSLGSDVLLQAIREADDR